MSRAESGWSSWWSLTRSAHGASASVVMKGVRARLRVARCNMKSSPRRCSAWAMAISGVMPMPPASSRWCGAVSASAK